MAVRILSDVLTIWEKIASGSSYCWSDRLPEIAILLDVNVMVIQYIYSNLSFQLEY